MTASTFHAHDMGFRAVAASSYQTVVVTVTGRG
jgi:hypothetical protein